jgi:hypothetical protein
LSAYTVSSQQQYPGAGSVLQQYPVMNTPAQPQYQLTAPPVSQHYPLQAQPTPLPGHKNLTQFLSMPPPPPPPLYTSSGPTQVPPWGLPPPHLLFSPVVSPVPQLFQPPGLLIATPDVGAPPATPPPPGLASPPNIKRKLNGYYGQNATYTDVDNPAFKRQKLIGGN